MVAETTTTKRGRRAKVKFQIEGESHTTTASEPEVGGGRSLRRGRRAEQTEGSFQISRLEPMFDSKATCSKAAVEETSEADDTSSKRGRKRATATEAQPEPPKTRRGGRKAQAARQKESEDEAVEMASAEAQTDVTDEASKPVVARRARKQPAAQEETANENENPEPKRGRRRAAKADTAPAFEQRAALRKSMVLTRAQRARLQAKN